MNRSVIAALLILLLGALGIGAYKFLVPKFEEEARLKTADGRTSLTVKMAGDSYLGYWFFNSPEAKKGLARRQTSLEFTDDGGNYEERLLKFSRHEYDMIVLPVSSYLQHGAKYGFPGVITLVISESKGADGIVGFADKFPQGKVSELNDSGLRIVFIPNSPSSFLLDFTITDFDLSNLASTQGWRDEVDSPKAVIEKARRKSGDAFVLWEPELSQALAEVPGLKYIWGSDKFGGYVIDVLVVNRDFLARHEADIVGLMESYFMTMGIYANNRDQMLSDMKSSTGLKPEVAEKILPKIDWFDLQENCNRMFGLSTAASIPASEGLASCIIQCTSVLKRTGKLTNDPLNGNPYLIINSNLIRTLLERTPSVSGKGGGGAIDFQPLDDAGWKRLREVGSLRVEPISFQSGNNLLDDDGKSKVDEMAKLLVNNYAPYRVVVRGHSGQGDEAENVKLSLERAQAVGQRLIAVFNVDPDRVHVEGLGASQPPTRKPGETERAYRYRMPRVEFILFEGSGF